MGDGALGQLEAYGVGDIRLAVGRFLGDRQHVQLRAKVGLEIFEEKIQIEVSKTGVISSSANFGTKVRALLRRNVAALNTL